MASILSYDETVPYTYADHGDDCRSIRRSCRTTEDWQTQVIRSLRDSGWTAGMMLYLPAPAPLHWILLLQYESNFSLINEQTLQATAAYKACGSDRRLWMALACRTLRARGWTPTMLGRAWQIPKTNIYRFLDTDLAALASDDAGYGDSTEERPPQAVSRKAV